MENSYQIQERLRMANKVVRNHALVAGGIGFIPVPLADIALVSATQVTMLYRLSRLYSVPFRKNAVKSISAVLLADLGMDGAMSLGGSLLKTIPFFGSWTGAVAVSAYSGAATYALGKVFVMHFEAGGHFLDFDPNKMKAYFKEKLEEGKRRMEEEREAAKNGTSTFSQDIKEETALVTEVVSDTKSQAVKAASDEAASANNEAPVDTVTAPGAQAQAETPAVPEDSQESDEVIEASAAGEESSKSNGKKKK